MTTSSKIELQNLRAFAEQHGELNFAHICTLALAGEAWALERLRQPRANLAAMLPLPTDRPGDLDEDRLAVIRSTDIARPQSAEDRAFDRRQERNCQ